MVLISSDSTGKRRYGHPALNGVLPQPWLPLKKGQSIVNHGRTNGAKPDKQAVVLTLRKRKSIMHGNRPSTFPAVSSPLRKGTTPRGRGLPDEPQDDDNPGPSELPMNNRLSYDQASGVIVLPEDSDWLGGESDSDAEYMSSPENQEIPNNVPALPHIRTPTKRYGTYYHHPERRGQSIPGAFPR